MADVTGPIRSLPGSYHQLPAGAMCDDHPDRPAVARVQGETDSFGSEMLDLCQECVDAIQQHNREGHHGTCDWCKRPGTLRPTRDFEEGLHGPVYHVCDPCRAKQNAEAQAEIEEFEDELGFDWHDSSDDYDPYEFDEDPQPTVDDPLYDDSGMMPVVVRGEVVAAVAIENNRGE